MIKKLLSATVSVTLCVCLVFAGTFTASAEMNIAEIIGALTGTTDSGSLNLSEALADFIKEQNEDKSESVIDTFVQNIKDKFNGVETPPDENTKDDDDSVTIDKGEAVNIAELFNLSVNKLKNGKPGFTRITSVSLADEMPPELLTFAGVLSGLLDSVIGTGDIFAGAVSGIDRETKVTEKFEVGNDVINNIPVSGKSYVACLEADDIKDYTITIYRSGAYKIHIDLPDVEGASAQSPLSHVFNTTDKAFATLNINGASLNVNVKLKYVTNYVECQVNKQGEVTNYITNSGVTFLFLQEDGSYSPEMPYFGINFEEKGVVYSFNTEYTAINFASRPMGDADNDSKVNSTDARLVLRHSAQIELIDEISLQYCDVTNDGNVTAADAREILRFSAKLTTLPSTQEVLGYSEYKQDPAVEKNIDDLLVLIMAYETAKDKEEQNALQSVYDNKYNQDNKSEETTSGELNTGSKVDEVLDFIGGIFNR